MTREKYKSILLGGISILIFVFLWYAASATGVFGKYDINRSRILLPSPDKVVLKFIEVIINGYLVGHVWISFKRVLMGFLIAVIMGIPIGILMGSKENFRLLIQPIINFIAPIPGVAWVPLAILWFGLGNDAAIFIIAVGSITPIITNTFQGMLSIDYNLKNVMKMFHANKFQMIRILILPSILPFLFTGFRLGLGYAWRVVIAAEMVGVPDGLGYVLNLGRSTAQTELTFITIIVLGILMTVMDKLIFNPIEMKLNKWRKEEIDAQHM